MDPLVPACWRLEPTLPCRTLRSKGSCISKPPESRVPLSVQIFTKRDVDVGVENCLVCLVRGVPPSALRVSWSRNGETVSGLEVSESQCYSELDLCLHFSSCLTFFPERGDVYSCRVRTTGLKHNVIRVWDVKMSEDPLEAAVLVFGIILGFVGFVVGVILIVMSR